MEKKFAAFVSFFLGGYGNAEMETIGTILDVASLCDENINLRKENEQLRNSLTALYRVGLYV